MELKSSPIASWLFRLVRGAVMALALPLGALAEGSVSSGADLSIIGIAHVAFQSPSLEISRTFSTGMLGYELAIKVEEPRPARGLRPWRNRP